MAMSEYIEVEMTLDSLDLIQIETLIELRIKELQKLKDDDPEMGWFIRAQLDESIEMWTGTQKKIKAARKEVKRIKKEADAAYYASRADRS
jgi:hypothetical protein